MATIFTNIINRELPAHIVYEDELCIVILDKFPAVRGQSLVIPKKDTDYIFNLDAELYSHIFVVAQKIALASDRAFGTSRTCLVVEGFEVPHAHIKLYPMAGGDTALGEKMSGGPEADDETLRITATQLQAAIEEAGE